MATVFSCNYKGGRSPLAGHTTDRRCLASLAIQGPKLVLTPVNDTINAFVLGGAQHLDQTRMGLATV